MSPKELKLTSQEAEPRFEFRKEIDKNRPSVTLYDGSAGFVFVMRDGKVFCAQAPYELTTEKFGAMKDSARPILKRLWEERIAAEIPEKEKQLEIKF